MSLDAIAQTTGMDKTVVRRNNGFLVQAELINEGNKKAPTKLVINLGRAYALNPSKILLLLPQGEYCVEVASKQYDILEQLQQYQKGGPSQKGLAAFFASAAIIYAEAQTGRKKKT